MSDTRCGIVNETDVIFFPDDPIVECCVKRDLRVFTSEVLYMDSDAVTMTQTGFQMLSEYSTSLPTGKADGKVWKRRLDDRSWRLCEYVDKGDPTRWSIREWKITVLS